MGGEGWLEPLEKNGGGGRVVGTIREENFIWNPNYIPPPAEGRFPENVLHQARINNVQVADVSLSGKGLL
ncbi:hypothetical protein CDAR_471601 [Caerostris darwini]|uniref:Uncharacterized protein n=1 Tax=Caerostris darwini TaxID=1538125 RepID=A0AAV4VZN9_9ARAC|nr:hypothetical protein CDAR_471601 [Caerostris darwini]